MNAPALVARVLAATVYLVAAQMALGMLLPASGPVPGNAGPWFLLSNLLVALVLCLLAMRSDWRGVRLAAAVSAIPAIIMLNNYLEGFFFLTASRIDWAVESLRTCLVAILTMPLWPLLFRQAQAGPSARFRVLGARAPGALVGRVALAIMAYPVLYFVAGMLVYPSIREFYTTQTIPPVGLVVALQLLVRGPILVGVCVLMARMLGLSRWAGAVAVGAALATLNGIAPLIVPSGVFPDAVRWAHLLEIAGSNIVFGAVVAWLLGPPTAMHQAVRQTA